MPTLVILGFSYHDIPGKELVSSMTDIYIIYSFYKERGFRIYLLTDMDTFPKEHDMLGLYTSGIINEKYKEFVDNFSSIRRVVKTKYDLENAFEDVSITQDRRLVFYYTGHGKKDNIILPDGCYSAMDLRNSIIKLGSNSFQSLNTDERSLSNGLDTIGSQIFIILDCCNPHGLYLPFMYIREKNDYMMMNNHFVLPRIILITSSEEDNPSKANMRYSIFTKELFTLLGDKRQTYHFQSIINTLDKVLTDQKCIVKASCPNLKTPWPWVLTSNIDFQINDLFNVIVVSRKKK
jgi:hypothetical protein